MAPEPFVYPYTVENPPGVVVNETGVSTPFAVLKPSVCVPGGVTMRDTFSWLLFSIASWLSRKRFTVWPVALTTRICELGGPDSVVLRQALRTVRQTSDRST